MFERFTDRARRALARAEEEARALGQDRVGTEHILLGLSRDTGSVAAQALAALGISLAELRRQGPPGGPYSSARRPVVIISLPFTPSAKAALDLSRREALLAGHNYIGTGHLLLGMLRDGTGTGAQALTRLGADLPGVRQRMLALLPDGQGKHEGSPRGEPESAAGRLDGADLDRRIAQARADKEAAIDAEDFDAAAVLRALERKLTAVQAARLRRPASDSQDGAA